jgi:adenylate cyclase
MNVSETVPNILIVDDTPENIQVLAGILKKSYKIKVANSGENALKIAFAEPYPDLILLDVMMPEMDGFEVCKRLKSDARTVEIPVIFVTAKGEVEDEAKGFDIGAMDYITKPVSPPIVEARVKTQLDLLANQRKLKGLSDKLSKYLSPQIYQSIFSGKQEADINAKRKKLTVFFSDIVQFTNRTENLEPEDLTRLLNNYFSKMAKIVFKYGGTLDKYIGDAVMVFFGDPESKGEKEDAVACISMALEMAETVKELQEEWHIAQVNKPFNIRIGISSGYCTVGNFGDKDRMDYTIIGNFVNLASRLESNAEPGKILISYNTWMLVKDNFECVSLEPINVKGFAEPVKVFEVVNQKVAAIENKDVIHFSGNGYNFSLNPKAIPKVMKKTVIENLNSIIDKLK